MHKDHSNKSAMSFQALLLYTYALLAFEGNRIGGYNGDMRLRYIYPSSIYCICCGKIIDESRTYGLCDTCVRDIPWANERTCEKCGKVLQGNWHNAKCADCLTRKHFFDRGYTVMEYGLHARAIISSYKFKEKNYLADHIASAMADRMRLVSQKFDYIVPVPTDIAAQRERGFDHTLLLGKRLSKELDIPLKLALGRKKTLYAQKKLDPIGREENIRGAFTLEESIKAEAVLLIDDVYTTGATADECAKVLKEGGAKRVDVLSFASGGNRHIVN